VTICIGLLAQDGIVIAADAQESDTYFKRSTQKIMTWQTVGNADGPPRNPAACVVAGAGDGGFIDAFTAELLADVRGEMTMTDFETYAKSKVESFYSTHVRPLLRVDTSCDFSVLIGAYFQRMSRLYKSYRTSFHSVQTAVVTAIGIGQQFALQTIENFPCLDVEHTEITAAAVISRTKDCVEGCGKYTDVVSLHNARIVPDEAHGSRLEDAAPILTRVSSARIADWERSFSGVWKRRQTKLYYELIEEEFKRSKTRVSEDQQ
jgi:hypothetical protein